MEDSTAMRALTVPADFVPLVAGGLVVGWGVHELVTEFVVGGIIMIALGVLCMLGGVMIVVANRRMRRALRELGAYLGGPRGARDRREL